MQAPAYNEATLDVYYCGQIHKAVLHGNVCDINAPHMIPVVNLESSQQIRLDIFGCAQSAQ